YHTYNSNGYFLRLTGSAYQNGIDFDGMTTGPLLSAGQWYHIAAIKNGNVRTLYVNGEAAPLSGTPVAVQANSDPLTIGVDYITSSRFFSGAIDEVRIWSTARTPAEVQENM